MSYVDEDQGLQYRHNEGERSGVPLSGPDREAPRAVAAELGTLRVFLYLIEVPSSRALGNPCSLFLPPKNVEGSGAFRGAFRGAFLLMHFRICKAQRRDGNYICNTVFNIPNSRRKVSPSAVQNEHAGPNAANFSKQASIAHVRDVQVREAETTQFANQRAVHGVNIVFCDVIKMCFVVKVGCPCALRQFRPLQRRPLLPQNEFFFQSSRHTGRFSHLRCPKGIDE
jgi:hypothetical protein